jgi:hypothetical protein
MIKIRRYSGRAYKPLVDFQSWRVAILNSSLDQLPEKRRWLERHRKTEEVFVLLQGKAWIVSAGSAPLPRKPYRIIPLTSGSVYQVTVGEWHGTICRPGTKLLVVENRDTGPSNSDRFKLGDSDRRIFISFCR